jgi:hypothetical protein
MQQAERVAVDASVAAAEDASLATSRWCRSRDCRRGPRWGAPVVVATIVAGAIRVVVLVFPLPLTLTLAFAAIIGVGGRRGRGRLRTRRFLPRWA